MNATEISELVPSVPKGLEIGLRNYWYPILQSEELGQEKPLSIHCLGENLVVWRDERNRPAALSDRCPHRSAKLSLGRVLEGKLQCALHGLRFNNEGECVLIPWEPDDSPGRAEVHARSYPAEELGGYIWAYLGDTAKFPPPPLIDEVPEELSREDEFLWFRMPTEVWRTNWLLAIDGGDGFHAVTLHAETQAVKQGTWEGGRPQAETTPLAERRVKIVQTSYGVRGIATDREGKPIHHGHLLDVKGERYLFPCISTNVIRPVPGVEPYVSRLWQFPIDDGRSIIQRYAVQKAATAEARERWKKLFTDVVRPRFKNISREDAMIAESQGDLVTARMNEHLFEPDISMYEVRQTIRDAFLAQLSGHRIAPTKESLVWPIG
ncbi:MAG TPA: aromatic ring-hydroxylating dioxygenase subunit alpha [Candidatus Binatia bacterium]|jgi:nitrite reductase/ring-hydroxylating ferredoxin subunit